MKRLLLASLLVSQAALGSSLSEDVESDLRKLVEDDDARAVVVGVYDDGEANVSGFGRLSRDNSAVPGGDTIFEIGSISKVFTVLLAESQVAAGRLEWDDTLAKRMPDIDFASDNVAEITLAELAAHRSGLPRLPDNMPMEDPMDPYADYDRQLLDAWLSGFSPQALVKTYAYSNLGMGVLGELAANAAGMSYGGALDKIIVERLGMRDTGVATRDPERTAQGFSDGADMPYWSGFDAMAGAGAIVSTANDLLIFLATNLGGKDPLLETVKSRALAADTAFGWHKLETDGGDTVLWHNGGTGGFSSFIAIREDTGQGCVILAASTKSQRVTEIGMTLVTGQAPAPALKAGRYEGAYELAPGFILTVFTENSRLLGQATGQAPFPLSPDGEHTFVFPAAGVRVVFRLPEEGPAESIEFSQGGQVTSAPRVDPAEGPRSYEAIEIEAEVLKDYEAEYQLAPGAVLTVLARDQQLFVQLTGQPAYPVFPYEKDRFFYKVVDAQLYFERDEAGEVVAVILNQGGERRATRK